MWRGREKIDSMDANHVTNLVALKTREIYKIGAYLSGFFFDKVLDSSCYGTARRKYRNSSTGYGKICEKTHRRSRLSRSISRLSILGSNYDSARISRRRGQIRGGTAFEPRLHLNNEQKYRSSSFSTTPIFSKHFLRSFDHGLCVV